jgi:hypothetical protein
VDLPIALAAPAREILREGDLRIASVATNHGEAPSVAYRIDGPGWSIAFSGDLDPSGLPNLTRLATGVDLLVFNCAVLDPPGSPRDLYTRHTAPRKIGEVAGAAGARRLHPHPAARGQGLPRGAGVGGRGLRGPGGAGRGPDASPPPRSLRAASPPRGAERSAGAVDTAPPEA